MKALRVLGSRPAKRPFPLFSWGIRLIESSNISHVVIELIEEKRIIHSRFNEVGFLPIKEFHEENETLHSYEIEIADEAYNAMMDFINGYVGKKKGYFKLIFGAVIPHLFRRCFGKYIHNTFAKGMDDAALCSQFVRFIAIRYWDFTVPALPYPENFTTTDTLEMMEKNIDMN